MNDSVDSLASSSLPAAALGFAEDMAKATEQLLDAVNELAATLAAEEDSDVNDDEVGGQARRDRAEEAVTEAMRLARDGVFEFRKRRMSDRGIVLWVSPEQFEQHDPQATGKPNYLPAVKRSEGKFTMPLYATPEPHGISTESLLGLAELALFGHGLAHAGDGDKSDRIREVARNIVAAYDPLRAALRSAKARAVLNLAERIPVPEPQLAATDCGPEHSTKLTDE